MLNFGNKEFRNLQEQVLYLSQKIAGVNSGVKGRVDNVPALGDLKSAKVGDMYLVGTEYPYYFYVKTTETEWTNLGTMASNVPGPKGEQGVQGIQGVDGSIIYIQSKPQDAPEGSISIDLDGSLYSYQNGKWTLKTNLKGPMGPTGLRGPQGETGPQGPQGEKGDKGDAGTSIKIGGVVASENLLPAKPVNGENAYLVGTSAPYLLYVWVNNGWLNAGPVVGNTTPNTSEARSQPLNNLKIGNNVYGNDLGLLSETGAALYTKLHTAMYGSNMNQRNIITFEIEGFADITEIVGNGSIVAIPSEDLLIYLLRGGKTFYFNEDGSASLIVPVPYTVSPQDIQANSFKIKVENEQTGDVNEGYLPKTLNSSSTPKVLTSVNNDLQWAEGGNGGLFYKIKEGETLTPEIFQKINKKEVICITEGARDAQFMMCVSIDKSNSGEIRLKFFTPTNNNVIERYILSISTTTYKVERYAYDNYQFYSEDNSKTKNYVRFLNGSRVPNTHVYNSYAPASLNTTPTPKVLQCKNSIMTWEEMPTSSKQYFNHDIVITFNNEKLVLNLVSSSNTPIDSITDIKTAYGSRTIVEMNGMFQDDDVMREVVYYNVQTNKVATYIPSTGVFKEIMLATHTDTDQRNYTLGTILDDVTLI